MLLRGLRVQIADIRSSHCCIQLMLLEPVCCIVHHIEERVVTLAN